jgi:DNA-binding LacI/PurR family transcriptional regulator
MSALRALAEAGLNVPDDVRVVGHGGLAIGELTVPRLSTVSQDLPRRAECLVELLLRRIAGEDTPAMVMEPKLLVRLSS